MSATLARALPLMTLLACSKTSGTTEPPFDRKAMLANIGEQVILPTYREFVDAAAFLEIRSAAYADAQTSSATVAERERTEAQEAWRDAMAVWQEAELFQLGPAGSSGSVTGGRDLRDEIYAWPTVNDCRVDQETAERGFDRPDFFETALVNAYGLAAVEYLLFRPDTGNACPSQLEINRGTWSAFSEAEIVARRAEYAARIAQQIRADASELAQAWDREGDGFVEELARAGEAGATYETERMAVDEMFAAMFYLELAVKDRKLAAPAGLSPACAQEVCPEALESRWSSHAKENLRSNVLAFRRAFLGGDPGSDGLGFDDFLEALGPEAAAISTTIEADTDDVLVRLDRMEGTLEDALAADPNQVRELHAAVKKVTDTLKSSFVTVLNIRVPDEGAGDND